MHGNHDSTILHRLSKIVCVISYKLRIWIIWHDLESWYLLRLAYIKFYIYLACRSEKHVSNLSKDIKDIEGSKRQAADEKVQGLKTENASLKSALAEATNE